jgi:hypothetical protein
MAILGNEFNTHAGGRTRTETIPIKGKFDPVGVARHVSVRDIGSYEVSCITVNGHK